LKVNISLCSSTIEHTSAVLHNFSQKAMLQVLPTASNLVRLKKLTDQSCFLFTCGRAQTNKLILSNCGSPTALHRYTTRHNESSDYLSVGCDWWCLAFTVYTPTPMTTVLFQYVICFIIIVLMLPLSRTGRSIHGSSLYATRHIC